MRSLLLCLLLFSFIASAAVPPEAPEKLQQVQQEHALAPEPAQSELLRAEGAPVKLSPESMEKIAAVERAIVHSFPEPTLRGVVSSRGYLVMGEDVSILEKALVASLAQRDAVFSAFRKVPGPEEAEKLLVGENFILVIGGPSQNEFAAELEKQGLATDEQVLDEGMILRSGELPSGAEFLIVSDKRGYMNVRKEGLYSSPLASFLPHWAVAPAAFLLSVLGLAAIPVIRIYLAGIFKSKEKPTKGKPEPEAPGIQLFGVRVRYQEIFSVFMGAFVYGMGVAYLFTGLSWDILLMGIASVIFVAILYYLRSLTRWILDRRHGTDSEYVVWKTGSALCWATALCGFTLQTPGFEVDEVPEEKRPHSAKMKLAVLGMAMAVALIIFAINFLWPHPWLQAYMCVASAIAVNEILPFKPMPGADIKSWDGKVWAFTFFTFIPTYFLINFLL